MIQMTIKMTDIADTGVMTSLNVEKLGETPREVFLSAIFNHVFSVVAEEMLPNCEQGSFEIAGENFEQVLKTSVKRIVNKAFNDKENEEGNSHV